MPDTPREPVIYTMPERFYTPPKKKVPATTVFFVVAGVAFLFVVLGAAWYFTRGLRVAQPVSAPPVTPPPVSPSPLAPAEDVPVSAQPAAQPVIETPPAAPETTLPRAADVDADGLTAREETLFKTSENQPDSDADGYLDGHEVINLYNPAGTAPEKLEAAGLATAFRNSLFGYEFLYPAGWKQESADPDGREIVFRTETSETVRVSAIDNANGLSLPEWYQTSVSGASPVLREIVSRSGSRGLATPNGLKAFMAKGNTVFALTYDTGTEAAVNFPRAFELMQISWNFIR